MERYSTEFKEYVRNRYLETRSINQTAEQCKVPWNTVHAWTKDIRTEAQKADPQQDPLIQALRAENEKLKAALAAILTNTLEIGRSFQVN